MWPFRTRSMRAGAHAGWRDGGRTREDVLFAFSRQLVGARGIGEVGQALFGAIDDLLDVDACLLLAVDDGSTRADVVAVLGGMDASVDGISIDLETSGGAVARVVRDGAPHRVLDAAAESLHETALVPALGAGGSALYVPLTASSGVIAVAVVSTREQRAFRHDEVEFVGKLASDAAVAIERARFARQLREVGERELVIAGIARLVRESLEPDEVLAIAAREVGEQSLATDVVACLLPGDDVPARIATWDGTGDPHVDVLDPDQLDGGIRLAVDDSQTVVSRAGDAAGPGTRVSLPLVHRGNVLGALSVLRPDHAFEPAELRLLELVAVEVAAALGYVRLHAAGRRHLEEQLSLARAAQSLTADLRFDRVLEHIVDEVVKLLHVESAAFYVYDRDRGTLTVSAAFGEAERQTIGETVGIRGLAGRVVRSGVSQLTNAYEDDLHGDFHPAFSGVRRAIAVPVRWQGDLRGVITVADRDASRTFGERDAALLEAFADLASLALHNAEGFAANSRQARIQAGFYRISEVLSASLSRQATLAALAQAATEVLDGTWAIVVGGDGDDEPLHVEGSWQAREQVLVGLDMPAAFERSTPELAAELGRVVTSHEVPQDERLGPKWRALMDEAGVVSQLAIPVLVHGSHDATVVVCFDGDVRFGDEELVVANNLATAAGAALERAGLFENERRTRRLSEVLADVSALIAETLKSQAVLDRIVDQASVLLEVDACVLAIAEGAATANAPASADLHVHSAAGRDGRLVDVLERSPVGALVEEVARSRRSVTVDDLASETSGQALEGEQYEGFLGVPLRHPRGHLIGVLTACSRRRRRWSPAEIASLESFASSAAIALRNAELYDDIRRERERLQALLGSIGEGICATDASGRVTIWNDAAQELTGLQADQAIGRPWRDVLGLDADTEVDEGQDVVAARPSGVPMWLSMTSSRLRRGELEAGWIHAFRDVSATHTLDRLKSDFVSTVSYVLRTPLTSIYGFARTLLRDDLEFPAEDRQVFLEYIAAETERLAQIVDDLLAVADIDAGSVEVRVDTVEVAPVLEGAMQQLQDRGVRRHVAVSGMDDLVVRADGERLQQVLVNLLDNAIRFTPEGGEVTLDARRAGSTVQLRVADRGAGISPVEQQQLFTKFYASPTAVGGAGTGLGLYISKGLVDAMGGRIGVSSVRGEGSTFTVELPDASTTTVTRA